MNSRQLMRLAEQALKHSYSPYSKIKVGAALLTKNGKVFTGGNIENSSYGLTICAERVAAAKAVSEGSSNFTAIAITSDKIDEIVPCGACLQVLAEFSPSIKILVKNRGGKIVSSPLKKLLPKGFRINA